MNYFELYEIPVGIDIDKSSVKKKYYKLSKKYHPDFYTMKSEEKQAEILALSTLNTNAFDTLNDENKLIAYILTLYNKYEEGNEKLPQAFLMEMMEMNEQLMELEFDADAKKLEEVKQELDKTKNNLKTLITSFPADLEEVTEEEREDVLKKLKDYHLKSKYLLRIQERLDNFAVH